MIRINKNPEYFLTVASERSISRAAEKLFLSQSYLSQHIIRLEQENGAKLFERKSPLELTEAGRVYRDYLESSSYLYRKLRADLDALSGGEEAVRIGTGTWRGALLLPHILPALLSKHPRAQVSLVEFPVSELMTQVQSGAADFAVMNTTVSALPVGLMQEVLAQERILLAASPTLPAAQAMQRAQQEGQGIDLRLLDGQMLIALNRELTVGRHVENFIERNHIRFARRIDTTNNSTALALAEQGLGFCFVVEGGLADARSRGLLTIDLGARDLVLPLSIVRKSGSFLSPAAQDAIDLIRAHYHRLMG